MPDCLAERAGFEPAVRGYRTLAFQASAFDRSATSPSLLGRRTLPEPRNRCNSLEDVQNPLAGDTPPAGTTAGEAHLLQNRAVIRGHAEPLHELRFGVSIGQGFYFQ
jgi:hypothetical protein